MLRKIKMKVTVFSSNQPRHLSLIKQLSKICSEVYFVNEVKTIFTGTVNDKIKKSVVMERYFRHVITSEKKIFGEINFLPSNIRTLSIKAGDLSLLKFSQVKDALNSDLYIVFGASYIKGWLIDFLVKKRAINIHMGLSPYYRGAACNFWALYDNNPHLVGSTIHLLSKSLDSGPMLYHAMSNVKTNPFEYTMSTVKSAFHSIYQRIKDKSIFKIEPIIIKISY